MASAKTAAAPKNRTRSKSKNPVRFVGIDIIKILACFFVVAVHFFLNSGFYQAPITMEFGIKLIPVRWIAFCCVPLFMITTGYLMKNKTLSKKYYLGILRVLIIYIVISFICMGFNHSYFNTQYSIWTVLRGLLMYNGDRYGWYVEYYISIFLIIPFLNAGYHALETKRRKRLLVITVCLLTIVSPTFYLGFNPAVQIRAFPGYFVRCYPIAYYFIGAYIRDFPLKKDWKHKLACLGIYVLALIWIWGVTYYQCRQNEDNNFIWNTWHYEDYSALPIAIMSTMVFLLLCDIQCRWKLLSRLFQILSNATFAAYLISYVFDSVYYTVLTTTIPDVQSRFPHAPRTVIEIFVLSMFSGVIIQFLYQIGEKSVRRMLQRHKKAKIAESRQ